MKKTLISLVLISIFLVACSACAYANEVVVQGYGSTRDAATSDALRVAVERAVGTMVSSETLVENYAVVKDEIYTKSQGFVESWDIIGESTKAGSIELTVRVRVNTDANSPLLNKLHYLRLIETILRDPRIGVIIPEYYNFHPTPNVIAENTVIRKLQEAGFTRILDVTQVENLRYNNTIKAIFNGDLNEAATLASNLALDYLVIGQGDAQYAAQMNGVYSVRTRIDAKLFKVDTGKIIASNGFSARGVDVTPIVAAQKGFEIAGNHLGDDLVHQFMSYARNPEKDLQFVVDGIDNVQQATMIEEQLKQVRGVQRIYVRSVQGGIATFDINYTGAPATLAAEVQRFNKIRLVITEITNSALKATLR